MPYDEARGDSDAVTRYLMQELADKEREIARLRKELAEAQAQVPWISEACGDDLWE